MSLSRDLLAQATLLATKEKSRPKQASLRRSVSAAYYALFHLLVDAAARRLVSGADRQPLRNCLARAFDHGVMKRAALQFAARNLSPRLSPGLNGLPLQDEIVRVATAFVDLQQHRHDVSTRVRGKAARTAVTAERRWSARHRLGGRLPRHRLIRAMFPRAALSTRST